MQNKVQSAGQGGIGESFVVALLAAIGFMAWGLWVNWEHGMASRVQVVLTQAGISFVATLGTAELLRWIASLVRGVRARGPITAGIGWLVINVLVFAAHWIFGTPEILKTMIPGMLTGAGFCYFYGTRMARGNKRMSEDFQK